MSIPYGERARVSLEAFQEEVNNWDLTLSREQKKMKTLRTHIRSKIHVNELDIIVTQIEAEMIRYRKLMDPKKVSVFLISSGSGLGHHSIIQQFFTQIYGLDGEYWSFCR